MAHNELTNTNISEGVDEREVPFDPAETTTCTTCGNSTTMHRYDRIEGGSFNEYWHWHCFDCGTSDTNDYFS